MNKKELIARCKELDIDTTALSTNAEREAAIQAKEAELAQEQVKSEEVNQEVESSDETSSEEAPQAETSEVETPEVETPEVETPEVETPEVETEKEDPTVYTDSRGRKFRFTEKAPKTMNIDGHPMSQAEILQSEEVISELVHGNNSFLTQIN